MSMKSSPIVHALPYPALEAGNLSFPEGQYEADANISKDGRSVEIEHKISGAAFIENLIEDGLVKFACQLSIPKAGVRRLLITERKGVVELDESIMGEPPKLRPVALYYNERIENIDDANEYELTEGCGVAEIWQGKKVRLLNGTRLARGDFLNITPSEYHFIRVKTSEDYDPGTFSVKPNTEEGFYFTVHAAPDVAKFIKNYGKDKTLRNSILTGVVGQCFSILKQDSDGSEEYSMEAFPNLVILSDKIKSQFDYDWTDKDNFDPMRVATMMYPIEVPKMLSDEDED